MTSPQNEFAERLLARCPKVERRDAEAFWLEARAAHAAVKKPRAAAFADLVADRLGEEHVLRALHAADLLLAAGALASDAAALAAFRALLGQRTSDVLASMRAPDLLKEEVEDRLLEKLLVATKERPPRLSTYGGRGELAAWLGAAATRTAIEVKRLKRYVDDHGGGSVSRLKLTAADPELELLQATHRERFRDALNGAFAKLTVEERNLLRMTLVDRMTVDQLADIFQVHRATAARRVARAREVLVEHVRGVLQKKYRMSEASISSDLKALGPHLDVSLSRLLRSAPG